MPICVSNRYSTILQRFYVSMRRGHGFVLPERLSKLHTQLLVDTGPRVAHQYWKENQPKS